MASATASTSCSSFWNFKGSSRSGHTNKVTSCRKLDGAAMWLINGVTTAFFASLERCSCIRVTTVEDTDEDINELPLIFNDGNTTRHEGKVSSVRRRHAKGNKAAKSSGGGYADETTE